MIVAVSDCVGETPDDVALCGVSEEEMGSVSVPDNIRSSRDHDSGLPFIEPRAVTQSIAID